MLDQNTDRMWFVIGALVVGAGIILLANKAMPEVFAKIGDSFRDITNKSTNTIKNQFELDNIIKSSDLRTYANAGHPQEVKLIDFNKETETWTLELPVNKANWSRGLSFRIPEVRVPYGAKFTVRYDVWVPEGIDNAVVTTDINNTFESNGKSVLMNDNDNESKRQFGLYEDGEYVTVSTNPLVGIPVKGGEWTTVWFSYENTSPANVNKEALYDYSNLGTTNPTDNAMTIKIRHVYGTLVNQDGEYINEKDEVF